MFGNREGLPTLAVRRSREGWSLLRTSEYQLIIGARFALMADRKFKLLRTFLLKLSITDGSDRLSYLMDDTESGKTAVVALFSER